MDDDDGVSANLQLSDQMTVLRVRPRELSDDEEFAYICYVIFSIISLVTALFLFVITVKVIQKVGATDKIIPIMLVMLQLSAISK